MYKLESKKTKRLTHITQTSKNSFHNGLVPRYVFLNQKGVSFKIYISCKYLSVYPLASVKDDGLVDI